MYYLPQNTRNDHKIEERPQKLTERPYGRFFQTVTFILFFSLKRKAKLTLLSPYVMYYLPQNIRNDHKNSRTTTKIDGTTIRSFLPNRDFYFYFFPLSEK